MYEYRLPESDLAVDGRPKRELEVILSGTVNNKQAQKS